MWHNEVLLHLVPRLTICAAYTNHIDMDNITFHCCLCSAFICSLSWVLWLIPNNAMVKNPFLRWCNCKPNCYLQWQCDQQKSGCWQKMYSLRHSVHYGEGRGRTWCPHSQKSAFDLTDLTGTEMTNLLSSQVQVSKTNHGSTWTFIQFTRLLTEQVIQ